MQKYALLLFLAFLLGATSCKKNVDTPTHVQKTVLVGLRKAPGDNQSSVFTFDPQQKVMKRISKPVISSTAAWAIDAKNGIYYILNYEGNEEQLIGVDLKTGAVVVHNKLNMQVGDFCFFEDKLYAVSGDNNGGIQISLYDIESNTMTKVFSLANGSQQYYGGIFDEAHGRFLARYNDNCVYNFRLYDLNTGHLLMEKNHFNELSFLESSSLDYNYFGLDFSSNSNGEFVSYSFRDNKEQAICAYSAGSLIDGGSTFDPVNSVFYYYKPSNSLSGYDLMMIDTKSGTTTDVPGIEMLGMVKTYTY